MSKRPATPTGSSRQTPASPEPALQPIWSAPVAAAEVPETGLHVELTADAGVREAIGRAAGLAALPRLEAEFDLMRLGSNGLRVSGQVSATVVQNCVATLDPIESRIVEPVDLVFTADAEAAAGGAGLQDAEAADPPEPLRNGAVDLGAVATEFLLLGIDPYPRKPDAVFDAPPVGDPASHPFAALAALKKPSGP